MSQAEKVNLICLLIVFAKTPVAGQVKTRIGSVIGNNQAALIYEQMLTKIITVSASNDKWRQAIAITPNSDEVYFEQLGLVVVKQCGVDLGVRMSNILSQGFQSGALQVIIVGSDIPTLSYAEIADAFSLLNFVPAVIGPSADGGFYLFGTTVEYGLVATRILQGNIQWSTAQVLGEMQVLCQKYSLPLAYLPLKKDIDTYEDWLDYQSAADWEE